MQCVMRVCVWFKKYDITKVKKQTNKTNRRVEPKRNASSLTRYASSEGHKGDGVDAVLEVNEASEMAGHVSDDSGTHAHRGNGDHEGGISISNTFT